MRSTLWRGLMLVVVAALFGADMRMATAQDDDVMALPVAGSRYQMMTFDSAIDADLYTNPFDRNDIEYVGVFVAPSGAEYVIPGFWMQPYRDDCDAPCTHEDWAADGDPVWQVRFTPKEAGEWKYTLQVRDDGSIASSVEGTFIVADSDLRGFIDVSTNNRYFEFDNGEAYFPIGHNLQWSWDDGGGVHAYEAWFADLQASGGNYARVVIDAPWFISLERDGVGRYSQVDAARLDELLDLARQYDVYLQLVIVWHQGLINYSGAPVLIPDEPARPAANASWESNPYNASRGGVIANPEQFFVDEGARELFRQRLRYIASRWGADPQVMAWEVMDRVERIDGGEMSARLSWLNDAMSYLRQVDAHGHLVTAATREFDRSFVESATVDFMQVQFFQRLPLESVGEHEAAVLERVRLALDANALVPVLVTAHSLNPWFEPTSSDPDGVHAQNTLWTAALSGAAGGAMSAWGETYFIPEGLSRFYGALASFAGDVAWNELALAPVEAGLVVLGDANGAYQSVRISDFTRQFRSANGVNVIRRITPDGVIPPLQGASSYLYGQVYNAPLHRPQMYQVTTSVDSYFEVGVRSVSDLSSARLLVAVDGVVMSEMALPVNTRGAALRVPLSAGTHVMTLNNGGEDWLEIDYLEVSRLIAPARALSLRDVDAGVVLAYIQHRGYTWDAEGVPDALTLEYRLDDMPQGRYIAQIWDLSVDAVVGEDVVRVGEDGVMRVLLPPFNTQLGLRVFRSDSE